MEERLEIGSELCGYNGMGLELFPLLGRFIEYLESSINLKLSDEGEFEENNVGSKST